MFNRLLSKSCFAAGTPLLTPNGSKAIEEFQPSDLILSRSEFAPNGPIVPKRVEEVFVRSAFVVELVVNGRVIQTAAEHPFYVQDLGQTVCHEIQPGNSLLSHDERWFEVDDLHLSGDCATAYNLRVADQTH